MKNIAIIFGGESSEYGVSLHSAYSVLQSIDETEFNVYRIGITQDGEWYYFTGDNAAIDNNTWHCQNNKNVEVRFGRTGGLFVEGKKLPIDVAFPVLHGKNGEDGTIQGVFEMAHIAYVGCGVISSAMCLDKEVTHIISENANIPMAKYIALRQYDDYQTAIDIVNSQFKYPLFVKPCAVGSSYGITKVKKPEELLGAIHFAFNYDKKLIIEEGIEGFEIGCAVLGNDILTIGEIDQIKTEQDFFDYEGKYNLTNTEILCPAMISQTLQTKAKAMAKTIYQSLQCSGLARVDIFVTPENELVFNEINTLPGFTSASRYPTMLSKIGIDYPKLISRLYDLALERYGQ